MNEPTTQPAFAAAAGSAIGGPGQATPREELIRQLLDSRIPKNEREWCAAREIERLREGIAEALMHLDTNCCIDGHSMKDSDAATALRRVWPNAQALPPGKVKEQHDLVQRCSRYEAALNRILNTEARTFHELCQVAADALRELSSAPSSNSTAHES